MNSTRLFKRYMKALFIKLIPQRTLELRTWPLHLVIE